ncbi:hypothetical protein SASPL_145097 [Salvia splendens]|uniref:Uncharacterized protein n=1 Tax=Salvia splendens TaxID=180675 RepID=A0A8X8WI84_SALSN|nr:hypothetical protein SASPL_145097 [Salvia splendens]
MPYSPRRLVAEPRRFSILFFGGDGGEERGEAEGDKGEIARMLTVKRERELEEGINKRLSRKLDKKWRQSIVPRPPPSLKKLKEEEAAEEAKESSA